MKITPSLNPYKIFFGSMRQSGTSFSDVEKYVRENSVEQRLGEIISDDTFCVGEGKYNKTYELPNTDKFLLKISKGINSDNVSEFQTGIKKEEDLFPKLNVGQSIATIGECMTLILKQKGCSLSIPYTHRSNLTQEDIDKYMSDITRLSNMPQESYNNFAREIKELLKQGCYLDYFNSNNIMITPDEINIVDIFQPENLKRNAFLFSSKESLMKALIDQNALPLVLPRISDEQTKELAKKVKTISEKVSSSMEMAGLPDNKLRMGIIDFLQDTLRSSDNKQFKKTLNSLLSLVSEEKE
ncbi:hypothetical protein II906_00680 [bacterium]|nr:hypothetical protein [bacterium]